MKDRATAPSVPGRYLVLDIGGTKIAAGVGTPGLTSLNHRATRPTLPARGGAAVLETVLELAGDVAREAGDSLAGVAVASAGVIDRETGTVTSATDLIPGWAGTPLGPALCEATGLPAFVLNDVHAHALGEMRCGAGAGIQDAIVVGVGTGIGGAIVVGGRVLFGTRNLAGHLGHIHHRLAEGFMCSCGRQGHIESVASGTGVVDLYRFRTGAGRVSTGADISRAADDQVRTASIAYWSPSGDASPADSPREREEAVPSGGLELLRLAEHGDAEALKAFVDAGTALGEVLGSLANSLDPQAIVLSGSMTGAGEQWWEALRGGYRRQAMDPVREVPLMRGRLGGDAPLLGALAYACDSRFKQ